MNNRIIPDNVAVAGFDDIYFSRTISPTLTMARAPIEEVGRETVCQLIRLLNGEQAQSLVLMRTEFGYPRIVWMQVKGGCSCIKPP